MNLEQFLVMKLGDIIDHMTDIDSVRGMKRKVGQKFNALERIMCHLTARLKTAEVTLQADILTLISERGPCRGEFSDE